MLSFISFIIDGAEVRKILDHIGEDSRPPRIAPTRAPPLWDGHDAVVEADAAADADPQWDPSAQSAPEYPSRSRHYLAQTRFRKRESAPLAGWTNSYDTCTQAVEFPIR